MPYAVPVHAPVPSASSSSSSTSTSTDTPTRPQHRRTRSSFSDETGPGAFASLGALPRRRPSATKRAVFHLNPDDSPPEDQNDHDDAATSAASPALAAPRFTAGAYPPLNSLKFAKDTGRFSPSVDPPSHIDIPPMTAPQITVGSSSSAPVPFPTSSPLPSPNTLTAKFRNSPLIPSPSSASSLPRTPSTPIILSNGKQLKPSLKSSSSSPNIPGDMMRTKHLRAQSAPSTPNVHKNVHFAESGLESIRVFNRTGKPMSVSKPPGDETETETEAENSNAERGGGSGGGMGSFPFPSLGSSSLGLSVSSSGSNIVHEIDPAPHVTSAIPAVAPPPLANVHLETVTLPRTRPPTLRGTVLVRNIAYEKNVAVRFTLDDWQTTSEVTCKHVVSLPGLPPPFPRQELRKPVDGQDVASMIVSGKRLEEKGPSWDRFSFTIRLEDYETKLCDRTLFLVARYGCPLGEWWDNNNHANYRIGFRKATGTSLSPLATPIPSAFAPLPVKDGEREKDSKHLAIPSIPQHLVSTVSQQRSFSAPNTLRYTPMTGTLVGIPVVSSSSKSAPAPPMLVRTMSSPYPPSPSQPLTHIEHPPSFATGQVQLLPRPDSPTTRETAAQSSSFIRKRLSLSNYVRPDSSPTDEKDARDMQEKKKQEATKGLVTPPTTPPGTVRIKDVGLPPTPPRVSSPPRVASPPRRRSPPPAVASKDTERSEGQQQQGEQHDEEIGEIPSEPEDEDDDTPRDEKVLRLNTTSLRVAAASPSSSPPSSGSASPTRGDDFLPFSPTSSKATSHPFLAFNQGGYLSPPTSRDASEDGGSGEAGRSSPATGTPPSEPVSSPLDSVLPYPSISSSSALKPAHLVLPDLGLSFSSPSHMRHPAETSNDHRNVIDDNGAVTPTPQAPNASGRVDTSDSSYAAFVRQWCFAQSAPPTPGVHTSSPTGPSSSSPRHQSAVPSSNGNGGGSSAGKRSGGNGGQQMMQMQQPWLGMGMALGNDAHHGGNGYGFPGFNFGGNLNADVGMVGAQMR